MSLRKIIRRTPLLLVVPFVLLIRLMGPFVLLRIGSINGRIGHLTMDIELSICQQEISKVKSKKQRIFDIYYLPTNISNEYIAQLWKTTLRVFPRWVVHPIHRVNQRVPGGAKYNVFHGISHADLTSLDQSDIHLKLPKEDEDDAWGQLATIGLDKTDKYVCLCVRDDKYLAQFEPLKDWSDHNIRDSDIQDYKLAAEELVSLGYKVIRMGKAVNERFPSDNSFIIDYANDSIRSDFLDVHIFKNACFVISTGTGMDFLGAVFRRPLGIVNVVSSFSLGEGEVVKLYQPQSLFHESMGRNISFPELLDLGWDQLTGESSFTKASLTPTRNTPLEIRGFCIEFVQKYQDGNVFYPNPNLLKKIRDRGLPRDKFANISDSWIKAHPDFIG